METVRVIDLFSGAGGLGEGFASYRREDGSAAFKIALSIEKDPAAYQTLRLRAFLRRFNEFPQEYYDWLMIGGTIPDWQSLYPLEWKAACQEAVCAELGKSATTKFISGATASWNPDRLVLIGGPPCQAYSLAGRSRNAGNPDYRPEHDDRHFLYREYCRVLDETGPAVFVMENVKGMLSSSVEGVAIFQKVMEDLECTGRGYRLYALTDRDQNGFFADHEPQDFLIKAEEHSVPQARHRVFIVGIRSDIENATAPTLSRRASRVTVNDVLGDLPRLRSGLSRNDGDDEWNAAVTEALDISGALVSEYPGNNPTGFLIELGKVEDQLRQTSLEGRQKRQRSRPLSNSFPELFRFLDDPRLFAFSGHETRGHMAKDLARYLYAACFAKAEGTSPVSRQFPSALAPNHKNWASGKFADRFRVQVGNLPSSTITSHISKDGHFYIHPDPTQCRSLTPREAARLQTFPDNYHFLGNRTQQFHQIGNAVPPFLAYQIAEAIAPVFFE